MWNHEKGRLTEDHAQSVLDELNELNRMKVLKRLVGENPSVRKHITEVLTKRTEHFKKTLRDKTVLQDAQCRTIERSLGALRGATRDCANLRERMETLLKIEKKNEVMKKQIAIIHLENTKNG